MAKDRLSYNQKESGELKKLLAEKERELLETRMDLTQGKTKNVHASIKVRREIARIKTSLRAKELGF